MCFAPEADAVVGGIIIAVGVDALRHVRAPKQLVLASIPLLLGIHQVTEAFIWWGLQDHVAHSVERVAVWSYLLFAFVALPILLPAGVGLIEGTVGRRRLIAAFTAVGAAAATALGGAMFRGPIDAAIDGSHITYNLGSLPNGGQLTAVYVIATCGALLASSYRDLAAFGALNLVVVPVLMWLTVSGFVSLWCFWAAIASIVVAFHLRRGARLLPAVVEMLPRI